MMKYQKVLSTAMAVTLAGSLLAACSDNKDKNTASPSASAGNSPAESQASQENKTPQEFRFTLASEPPSLDPALMTDAQSSIVASGLYDGLTRLNPEGVPEPAIAKEWTVSDDGKTYTFKLRDDAKWSNGDPVTANDFEYSWKRALNPETASEYAYMLFYLENGEKYNSEQATEDEVGVKALDATTLEVKLASATPYFNSLIAHYTYWPVHPASVDGKPEWAADAKTIVSNGPFLLKDWAHGDKLVLTKNPDYYNKDKVNFDTVTISLVESESTVFSMFQTDKIDWIGAQAGSVPTDQVPQLVADKKSDNQRNRVDVLLSVQHEAKAV